MAVGIRVPQTPSELVGALECTLATLDTSKQETTRARTTAMGTPYLPLGPTWGPKGAPPHPCTYATSSHSSPETMACWLRCSLTRQPSSPKWPCAGGGLASESPHQLRQHHHLGPALQSDTLPEGKGPTPGAVTPWLLLLGPPGLPISAHRKVRPRSGPTGCPLLQSRACYAPGPLQPSRWPPGGPKHPGEDQGPFPLARNEDGGQELLPMTSPLPEYHLTVPCTCPAHTSPHHQ